ncbi:hypothetical protein Leryth_017878 [Lithospermum erythrorhizon]|nr:hypothetical protein Leryth_017878 [Lithospermum erythrorhizon]
MASDQNKVYSVWGLPMDLMAARLKKLMESLKSVGELDMFNKACEVLKAYNATADKLKTLLSKGNFFNQIVYRLIHPTQEVRPHLGLLYTDEKKLAQERVYALDESICSLSFKISRLALYTTDTEDKSLKSWEKMAESNLDLN